MDIFEQFKKVTGLKFIYRGRRRGKVIPEKEYHSFVSLLNSHNIPYCMDSGVLLGIMRDGRLLANEKDIDLQMWVEDEERLKQIFPLLKKNGWKITKWMYKGHVYQYRFLRSQHIPVHIMLFRKQGDWAWCPAGRATGNPFSWKPARLIYRLFSRARTALRNLLKKTDVARWPWNVRRDLGTWWVPCRFFERVSYSKEFDIYIPEQWDEYLSFRYGDWKIPNSNWDFWKDDGALKQRPPDQMVDLYHKKSLSRRSSTST